jgi:hypothetical protein
MGAKETACIRLIIATTTVHLNQVRRHRRNHRQNHRRNRLRRHRRRQQQHQLRTSWENAQLIAKMILIAMYVRIDNSIMFVLKPLLTILLFQTGLECMIRQKGRDRKKAVPGCKKPRQKKNMCYKPPQELLLRVCEVDCKVDLDCAVSECDIRSDCQLKYVRLEAAAHYSVVSDWPRMYDSERKKK